MLKFDCCNAMFGYTFYTDLKVSKSLPFSNRPNIFLTTNANAVYSSYLVMPMDSLASIVARYSTTISDLMNISAMGSIVVKAGDILIVPLPDA
ncbi:hypothetical protein IFM89_022905 [Coptis chinensis]|uniref:LysM domain-containing protein n=1 Tax=Coptis chinensis TaxID=261450 RepID=A0A835MF67_9MAGN|nr:hypothetical protein IFM89_022905 [Coptis chinensis]